MVKMKSNDPAYWMLFDGYESYTNVYNKDCYICRDPEYSQMGLPLCYPCLICGDHVPADDIVCDSGHEQPTDPWSEFRVRKEYNLKMPKEMFQQMTVCYYDVWKTYK